MPIPARTTLVRTGWWWRSGDRKWTDEYLCTAPSRRSPPSRAAFPPRGHKWNNTWQSPLPLDLDKRDGERNVQRWQLCLTIIIKHEDTAGKTGYGDTGEVMENAVRVQKCSKVTAWREIWSYLHCCSPPGPQQWCSGKIACRQIHPPGDLRERREDEDNLQDRQGLQVDYRLTFLGQCHLVLTFLVFSKFLEWKQTNETLQLLTGAPKSGLLKCFRLNTSGVVIDHNYCHDWVNHNVT